jgi:hypothetical protein
MRGASARSLPDDRLLLRTDGLHSTLFELDVADAALAVIRRASALGGLETAIGGVGRARSDQQVLLVVLRGMVRELESTSASGPVNQ